MFVPDILDAVAAQIREQTDGWRVYSGPTNTPVLPAVVVVPRAGDFLDHWGTFQDGARQGSVAEVRVVVAVFASSGSDRAGGRSVLSAVSSDADEPTVWDALNFDPTFGGAVHTSIARVVRWLGPVVLGDPSAQMFAWGAEIDVDLFVPRGSAGEG